MNIQLGYLETKKVLGDFQGKWYTFFTAKEAEGSWRKFLNYLMKDVQIDLSFWSDQNFGAICVSYIKTGWSLRHADWQCSNY